MKLVRHFFTLKILHSGGNIGSSTNENLNHFYLYRPLVKPQQAVEKLN